MKEQIDTLHAIGRAIATLRAARKACSDVGLQDVAHNTQLELDGLEEAYDSIVEQMFASPPPEKE